MKQLEVMVLEVLEEWDRWRKRIVKPKGKPVKIELDGLKKNTLVGAELIDLERAKIGELLKKNKSEFT